MPIVPGSTLKGKLRSLLAAYQDNAAKDPSEDCEPILRLFGSSSPIRRSRLQFSDAFVSNADDFREIGLTEIKFENTINRVTLEAMPRQIERVVSGVEFDVNIVYNIENADQIEEDIALLAKGIRLLQLDYLGGHGTRGNGRVGFSGFSVEPLFCDNLTNEQIEQYTSILKGVENYALLTV